MDPGTYDTGWEYPSRIFQVPSDPYNIDTYREWEYMEGWIVAYAKDGVIIGNGGTIISDYLDNTTDYIYNHVSDTNSSRYYYPIATTGYHFSIPSEAYINYINVAMKVVAKTSSSVNITDIRSGAGIINPYYPSLSYPSTNIKSGVTVPRTTSSDEYPHAIWVYVNKWNYQWGGITVAEANNSGFTIWTDFYQSSANPGYSSQLRLYAVGVLINYTVPTGANLIRMGTF